MMATEYEEVQEQSQELWYMQKYDITLQYMKCDLVAIPNRLIMLLYHVPRRLLEMYGFFGTKAGDMAEADEIDKQLHVQLEHAQEKSKFKLHSLMVDSNRLSRSLARLFRRDGGKDEAGFQRRRRSMHSLREKQAQFRHVKLRHRKERILENFQEMVRPSRAVLPPVFAPHAPGYVAQQVVVTCSRFLCILHGSAISVHRELLCGQGASRQGRAGGGHEACDVCRGQVYFAALQAPGDGDCGARAAHYARPRP